MIGFDFSECKDRLSPIYGRSDRDDALLNRILRIIESSLEEGYRNSCDSIMRVNLIPLCFVRQRRSKIDAIVTFLNPNDFITYLLLSYQYFTYGNGRNVDGVGPMLSRKYLNDIRNHILQPYGLKCWSFAMHGDFGREIRLRFHDDMMRRTYSESSNTPFPVFYGYYRMYLKLGFSEMCNRCKYRGTQGLFRKTCSNYGLRFSVRYDPRENRSLQVHEKMPTPVA